MPALQFIRSESPVVCANRRRWVQASVFDVWELAKKRWGRNLNLRQTTRPPATLRFLISGLQPSPGYGLAS